MATLSPIGIPRVNRYPSPNDLAMARPGTARSQKIFKFYPEEISFRDIEPNQTYVAWITVRNDSSCRRKIRVAKPNTSNFTIEVHNEDSSNALSPGLSLKIKVIFNSPSGKDAIMPFHDELLVQGDGDGNRATQFRVPMHATPFAPNIVFDRFVNIGTVVVSSNTVKYVTFENKGKRKGTFKIKMPEDANFKVTPNTAVLEAAGEAGSTLDVKVEFMASELGVLNYKGEVTTTGVEGENVPAVLDFKGNVVKQSLELTMPGKAAGPVNEIAFGTLYHGQTRVARGFLVNNSPLPCNFTISLNDGKQDENAMMNEDDDERINENDNARQDILIIPSEGRLLPNTQVELEFVFQPPLLESTKGFAAGRLAASTNYLRTACITSQDTNQRTIVTLSGMAAEPNLCLSMQEFNFGECPVNERRDITVMLKNESNHLPCSFDFTKIAQFSTNPMKGKLAPMQSRSVLMTYMPRNLGVQKGYIKMMVEHGIQNLRVKLMGSSKTVGKAMRQTHGTKLPVDFKSTITFVDPKLPLPQEEKKERPPANAADRDESKRKLTGLRNDHLESRYTYPTEEYESKRANTKRANAFVRDSYKSKERSRAREKRLDPNDPVSMGLDFAEGLVEPRIELPEPEGKLWLQYPMGGYEGQLRHKPQTIQADSARGKKKKKFKPNPTTQAERVDCETALCHQDLQNIIRGPKVLDFGRLFLDAHCTKKFMITNSLENHILAQFNVEDAPELSQSQGLSQMIPPGRTAEFDFKFQSDKVQGFRKSISYTINGKHNYTFNALCEVVPVALETDKEQLFFQFTGDNTTFKVTEKIQLTNPSNVLVDFWFTIEDENFTVSPSKGTLEHFKKTTVEVTYEPKHAAKRFEVPLTMHVKNGPKRNIPCHASLQEASCVIKQKVMDLGTLCVGQRINKQITIKNNGKAKTTFKVSQCPKGVTVTPSTAPLLPGASLPLNINIFSAEEKQWSEQISVVVRGVTAKAKPVKFMMEGCSVTPDVEVMQDDFDFSGVTIGSSLAHPLTISNRGKVPVSLYLNLDDYKEFTVKFPPEWLKEESCPLQKITLQEARAAVDGRPPPEPQEDGVGEQHAYELTVPAESDLGIELVFTPLHVRKHSFALPLAVAGIRTFPGVQRVVVGKGLKPRVRLQSHSIDFGQRVVLKPERALKNPYTLRLEMSNEELTDLEWCLKMPEHIEGFVDSGRKLTSAEGDDLALERLMTMVAGAKNNADVTWRIEPTSGTMLPGHSCTVNIYFAPIQHMQYSFPVDLFLGSHSPQGKPYFQIPFAGQGAFPMLAFDRTEVLLPVVPVGSLSKTSFKIYNRGYENLELRYHLPQDSSRVPLTVAFPDGSTLGIGRDEISVEVSFSSKKPMSFTANLDFLDTDGNKFTVAVTGVTDSSLLTLQEFVDQRRKGFTLKAKAGTGVIMHIKSQRELGMKPLDLPLENGKNKIPVEQPLKLPDLTNTTHDNIYEHSVRSLLGYLQASGLISSSQSPKEFNNSVRHFPADFIASNGKMLFELTKQLSGKNPIKATNDNNKKGEEKKDSTLELMANYERLLTFLKANGGLVNMCKAKYFLSHHQFSRVLNLEEDTESNSGHDNEAELKRIRDQAEKGFSQRSKQCWLTVMYQVVKVFILSRVTPKQYKTLAGMTAEAADIDHGTLVSNVYSHGESILLHWLTYHFANENPHAARRLVNFDSDLADGLVLAAVLLAHSPNLKSLGTIIHDCKDAEHRLANCRMVCDALKEFGLVYHITPEEIAHPSARNMLMFALYLYHKLPFFVPKTVIEFKGALDQSMVKHIELVNPSKKPVNYVVRLEGSMDFAINADTVKLEPKGRNGDKVKFAVHFKSRFSKPVEGRLVFTSERDSGANASTLVFLLKSNITSRTAVELHEMNSSVYNAENLEIAFRNPFNDDCTFQVMLLPVDEPTPANPLGKSTSSKKKGKKKGDFNLKTPAEELFPTAFWCKTDKLKVRAGAVARLPIQFLPLRCGSYRTQIVFLDENIGELMHELIGESGLPETHETIKWTLIGKQSVAREIVVPFQNQFLERARQATLDRVSSLSRKQREALKAAPTEPGAPRRMQVLKADLIKDNTAYSVSSSSPFFIVPPSVMISKEDPEAKRPNRGKDLADTMLPLTFNPKAPGLYKSEIVLQSAVDTRVFFVDVVVREEAAVPTIEFKIPAGESILQDIPVINSTDELWAIRATISGAKDVFSGPNDLAVPAHSQVSYSLAFKPNWATTHEAKLELLNSRTGEKFEYNLVGVGQEPLALGHILIECQAREVVKQSLPLTNNTKQAIEYLVESDLPNISGATCVRVPPGMTSEYELCICPQLGGSYHGSVSFVSPDKRFQWYAVELQATSPAPEQTIEVTAFLRKAAAIQIGMTNPLDEVLEFDVRIDASGLFGDQSMTLGPRETGLYELVFSPLVAGTYKGAVSFINAKAGEFWYDLVLTGENPPPTELPSMECEVGRKATQTIQLDNPTEEDIVLKGFTSNARNFSFSPSRLAVPAYGTLEVTITYTPNTIGEWQGSSMSFKHPTVGEWNYEIKGRGGRPRKMKLTTVFAAIGTRYSHTLLFRNPFLDPITVHISMHEENTNAFKLFMKRTTITLQPQGTTQIPFLFEPRVIQTHQAVIEVNSPDVDEGISWSYPIKGVGEGAVARNTIDIECQARSVLEDEFDLRLAGIEPGRTEHYSCVIEADEKHEGFLRRALTVELVEDKLKSTSTEQMVSLKLKFEPLRPVSTPADLVITKRSGGRWRFPLNIEVSEPKIDDTIKIEAMIHTTQSVSFSLANQFEIFSDFKAYMTPDSPSEFKVFPATGLLEPMSSKEGTQFQVSFTPVEYGKQYVGKLLIVTEDMQWTYEVRGTHPRYVAPTASASVVTKMDPAVVRARKHQRGSRKGKNYISRNSRAAKTYDAMMQSVPPVAPPSPERPSSRRRRARGSSRQKEGDARARFQGADGGTITMARQEFLQ